MINMFLGDINSSTWY